MTHVIDSAATPRIARITSALPFWMAWLLIPLVWLGAFLGSWWVLLPIMCTWYLFSILDAALGANTENEDPSTDDAHLSWYKLITQTWVPLQMLSLFGLIAYTAQAGHLSGWELFGIFVGAGVMTGTVGINFAHELMHQRNALERWLGDLLLAMVLYSHFRSEHLLVHHRYVGTARDPVTARYNESFFRFFPRVLRESWVSSFRAEVALLARKDIAWHHPRNPFWRYAGLQLAMLALAWVLGGALGLLFFVTQAVVAIWQLELVNYVEHYGLTRKHLGEGKYEPVKPRHSWNASHKASNWLLINLQRHSDHHFRPDRRFPLLQTYAEDEAPQLPYGYPLMTMAAMVPPLWRRVMNKRVRAWRKRFYPEIQDWRPYNKALLPKPR